MVKEQSLTLATQYYDAMASKDIAAMEKTLHPKVTFIGPLVTLKGKEPVLEGAQQFMGFFSKLTMRAMSGSEDHAMVAYDLECPAPIGTFKVAALLKVQDGLLNHIELFCDAGQLKK